MVVIYDIFMHFYEKGTLLKFGSCQSKHEGIHKAIRKGYVLGCALGKSLNYTVFIACHYIYNTNWQTRDFKSVELCGL